MEINCTKCGVIFNKCPSHVKKNNFCSRNCLYSFRKNNGTRKGMINPPEMRLKQSLSHMGDKNPMFGRSLSEDHKKKISQNNIGKHNYWLGKKQPEELVEKRTAQLRGRVHTEEARKKISVANKGRKLSKERCEEMSQLAAKRVQEGWSGHKSSKRGKYFSIKSGLYLHYRSSYEKKAYEILDSMDDVCVFSADGYRVPYYFKGKRKIYVPDIKVVKFDGTVEVIEVKAQWQISDERVQNKIKYAKDFFDKIGFKFSVWTEKELRNG